MSFKKKKKKKKKEEEEEEEEESEAVFNPQSKFWTFSSLSMCLTSEVTLQKGST
jgi:hypothetical protein